MDAKQLKLDDGCYCTVPRKRCSVEGLPCKASVRELSKVHSKGKVPGLDKKYIPKEKHVENVEKVDEILILECKSLEATMEIKQQAQEMIEHQNGKIDTPLGTASQAAHETLTLKCKNLETARIENEVPNFNKFPENNANLTYLPAKKNTEAVDDIATLEYKNVETSKTIKNLPSRYVVQERNEILTSEYKSMETDKVIMKKVPEISKSQVNNVNIIDTPSGTIAMEIENNFLNRLEKKLIENPNTHVYLRELNSGQLIVDFKPQDNVSNLKVEVIKSPTGEIQFVLFKNLSTYIQPCGTCESVCEQATDVESIILKVIRSECKLKGTATDSRRRVCNEAQIDSMAKKRLATKGTAKMEREEIRKFIEDILLNEIPKVRKIHSCKLTDEERNSIELSKKEIEIFYESNRGKMKLNVRGASGATACVEAYLTRTLSGNIAMDIKDMNCVGVIADSSQECPVLLEKSPSGAYFLFVSNQKPEQEPNTILRRTSSGQLLIVITEPVLRSFILPRPPLKHLAQEKLHKVRVKSASSRVTALPAFLKMTPSKNYILVLDKEFEKQFNDHIKNSMNNYSQCQIELQKTASDAIVINFDNECNENICTNKQNALLIKTSSGHLRILMNDQEYNNFSQSLLKVDSNRSSKAFEELLQHMHTLSSPGCSKSKNKPESPVKKKQSSDSQLLDSDKNSHLTNFDRPIKIQKTLSGQYAVVLDKNSKKTFLTDLKNYLSINTKGIVPVRKMGSGDVIIVLDTKGQSTDLYGSLTITPSGNVYVTMDENVLKALSSTPSGMTQLGSHHIIKKVQYPENKGVDTSCTADLDDCVCDPSCICEDLLECVDKKKKSQDLKFGHSNKNSLRRNLPCNPSKCYASCCTKNRFTRTNVKEKPPCECINPSYREQRNTPQCYYIMYDSVSTTHEKLSNNLLAASSPCSETDNNTVSTDILDDSVKEFTSVTTYESVDSSTYDWNYMPPQLPPFLGNFRPIVIS